MPEKRSPEDVFEALLSAGDARAATPSGRRLVAVARALRSNAQPSIDPRFRVRLRNQLLGLASTSEEALFEEAVSGRIAHVPDLAPLVKIAAALDHSAVRALVPAEFRYRLRARLLAEAALSDGTERGLVRIASVLARGNQRMRRSLRIVAATGMAALLLMGSSLAFVGSATALPGQAVLYDLKLVRESAQLVPASGAREGLLLLDFARTRTVELRALVRRGERNESLYVRTLDRMDAQTLLGSRIIFSHHRADPAPDLLAEVQSFAQVQAQELASLVELLPPGAQPAARDSQGLVEKVAERAAAKLLGCADVCPDNALQVPASADPAARTTDSSHGTTTSQEEQQCTYCAPPREEDAADEPAARTDHDDQQQEPAPPKKRAGGSGPPPADDPLLVVPDAPRTDIDDTVDDILDDLLDAPPAPSTPALPVAPIPRAPLLEPQVPVVQLP